MANDIARLGSSIQNVQLQKMRVSPTAQRDFKETRSKAIAADFDPEMLGYPTVNLRKGHYYIIDGQHRIEGTKLFLGDGWESQNISCRVYVGLTEREEAQMFLRLNNQLTVTAFDKFKVAVTSESAEALSVKKAVESVGLNIAREKKDGSVSCVGTLLKIHRRADAKTLSRTLTIVSKSFGTIGMTNSVIDGVSLVCERYNGELRDGEAIARLSEMRGGVGSLITRANLLRQQTGASVPVCVGAAVVEQVNRGNRSKLPAWWQE